MNHFQSVADRLSAYDLDGFLVLSEPNRLYVTGFPSTAGAALVTEEGSWFFTDSRYIEAARRAITGAEVRENTAKQTTLTQVEELIRSRGLRRVGYEDAYLTVAELRRLEEKLRCELVPATRLLLELRAVKDPEEIQQMIAAQRIAEKALAEVLDFIRPGRTEREIAAFLQYRMLLGGGEKMSFDPIVVSGPNGSMPHGVPGDRPVGEGDFITMDFGCVYGGYCSDMTRTVAVGHVTEEMERVHAVVLEAQQAGITAARAGITGAAVHNAAAAVINRAGYGPYFGHAFGHSLGVEIHESPNATPSNEESLPAGAVISAEPGIYLPGRFGVRIEDVIIIEERGCRDITLADKELLILPASK